MNTKQAGLALLVAMGGVASVQAQTLGQHPAVLVQRMAQHIDPNTFIVAHPAHVTSAAGHAGYEHPALTAWREAAHPKVDPNSFLVQPPATTAWPQAGGAVVADLLAAR